jgi:hypothetical protein
LKQNQNQRKLTRIAQRPHIQKENPDPTQLETGKNRVATRILKEKKKKNKKNPEEDT